MSRVAVADLLADLIGERVNAGAGQAPAKAANPANREHPYGFWVDEGSASGLRILRKLPGPNHGLAGFADDSQTPDRPQSEQPRGFSQDSQDSQAVPADQARHRATLHRLLRWGWSEAEAAAVAERLARRDREADERRLCVECRSFGPGRCRNHRRAGLMTPEIGPTLAALPQVCPAFAPNVD